MADEEENKKTEHDIKIEKSKAPPYDPDDPVMIAMKTKKSIVEVLGIEHRLFKAMTKPDFTVNGFVNELKKDGINITVQSVSKYIKKTKKAQAKLASRDLQMANQVKRLTLDYTKEIRAILDEVKEVKNTAKDTKDMITYNQMIDKLYKGIELIAKLTGDLKPSHTTDITVIYQQVTEDIENEMKDIQKKIQDTSRTIDVDYEIEKEDEIMADYLNKNKKIYEE